LKHYEDGKREEKFLAHVAREFNAASDTDAASILEKYVDVQSWINVIAVNDIVGQTDDWK